MIGVNASIPACPRLVIVNVLPCSSATSACPARTRSVRARRRADSAASHNGQARG